MHKPYHGRSAEEKNLGARGRLDMPGRKAKTSEKVKETKSPSESRGCGGEGVESALLLGERQGHSLGWEGAGVSK